MDYSISITPHENYLHVVTEGTGNSKNALIVWKQITAACEQYKCYKILGEQDLDNSLSTNDALDFPSIFKQAGITTMHRIAWVDRNPRTRDTTVFVRDILTNRSIVNGRLFTDVKKAKQWLLGGEAKTEGNFSEESE